MEKQMDNQMDTRNSVKKPLVTCLSTVLIVSIISLPFRIDLLSANDMDYLEDTKRAFIFAIYVIVAIEIVIQILGIVAISHCNYCDSNAFIILLWFQFIYHLSSGQPFYFCGFQSNNRF